MTIHIDLKDIKCSKCSAPFVPFEKNFRCPSCNEPTDEFFDFIPEIVYSLEYHKQRYGRFMPDAWSINSLAEQIQSIIFKIFDDFKIKNPSDSEKFISDYLEEIDWGDQQYLKNHIKDITSATLIEYDKMSDDTKNQIKSDITNIQTIQKKKGFWRIFIP